MEASVTLTLQPFDVPDFVNRELTQAEEKRSQYEYTAQRVPLSSLDPYTLDRMCIEFRNAVFAKAGKQQPPTDGGRKS